MTGGSAIFPDEEEEEDFDEDDLSMMIGWGNNNEVSSLASGATSLARTLVLLTVSLMFIFSVDLCDNGL